MRPICIVILSFLSGISSCLTWPGHGKLNDGIVGWLGELKLIRFQQVHQRSVMRVHLRPITFQSVKSDDFAGFKYTYTQLTNA